MLTRGHRFLALALASVVACTAAQPTAPAAVDTPAAVPVVTAEPTPPAVDDAAAGFDAVVHIEAEPGAKRLQAVWLERADGARWIVAYRPEPWLQPFADQRVHVTGRRYAPQGQAVSAVHFRIATIALADDAAVAGVVALGVEQRMTGRFSEVVGEAGTKGEGERWSVFTDGRGESYALANAPEGLTVGVEVEIVAREATYSRYAAHRGGPMIWVVAIDGADDQRRPTATKRPAPGP